MKKPFTCIDAAALKPRGNFLNFSVAFSVVNSDNCVKNRPVLVEIQVQCPHCGEVITTMADTSQAITRRLRIVKFAARP